MALLSAANLLSAVSMFHLTIAYFFLVSPALISNQNLVFILGAAMDLSSPTATFSKPSQSLAFLSASLALLGIADLTAITLPKELFSYYWSSQAPVRLLFFFVLTGYAYAFQPGGALAMGKRLGWDCLNNSVMFTWGFVEMLLWFWIFVTLREERQAHAARLQEQRKAQEDIL